MTPERYKQASRLYHAALEMEPPQWTAYLAEACGGDEDLRQEVASLLEYETRGERLIDQPALEAAAQAIAEDQATFTAPSLTGQSVGHCRILSLLGKGGMGEVWLAEDTHLSRKVAVKLLPAEFTADADRVRRFAQEARAASALNHPNIITIHEIGEAPVAHGKTHYIVTEYVEGKTLRQQMEDAPGNRIRLAEAIDLAVQVAAALVAAHEAGITHRDIKPENVMVRRDGYVKVVDFGLAKLTEESQGEWETERVRDDSLVPLSPTPPLSFSGVVMGTPRYMSPEQARGERVDARTDIFSLGGMLYEMITGRTPFAGTTLDELIAAILHNSPPPLSECAPEAPPEMQRILGKAMCKNRDERYETVKELLLDLKNLTEEQAFVTRSARQSASLPASRSNESAISRTSSDAENIVRQIKQYKRGIAIALAMLIITTATIAYFTRKGDNSLAILPFVNANVDTKNIALPDGITEALINNLSQLPHLKLIARRSVIRINGEQPDLQAIGRELGVHAVLTGSVTQRGDSLEINTELVDVESKSLTWRKQYYVKSDDIFRVQADIAQKISQELRVKITGEDKQRLAKQYSQNPEANRFYLLGRDFWIKFGLENNREAIKYFVLAKDQDPNYAMAYAGLAKTYGVMGLNGEVAPKTILPKYKEAVTKALELDNELAEAHAALAGIGLFYEGDWPSAQQELRRSLDLNANDPLTHVLYSYFYTAMGRFDEALAEVKLHQQLDPASRPMYANMVRAYYFARRYDEAIETNRKALKLELDLRSTHLFAGAAYEQKGMYEEAISELQKASGLPGGFPAALGALGHVYAMSRKRREAMKKLDELTAMSRQRYVSPLDLAILYIGLGDKEQALDQLDKAYEDRAGWLINLKVEPRFDSLRSDPRFKDLLRRVGHTP